MSDEQTQADFLQVARERGVRSLRVLVVEMRR